MGQLKFFTKCTWKLNDAFGVSVELASIYKSEANR